MLLELSVQRPFVSASKMSTSFNSRYSGGKNLNPNDETLTNSYNESYSYNNTPPRSVVQCYSVSTGKVSTLLRSPSQSSISSIEVAEINHLSEQFMNKNEKEGQQIRAINSSSPSFVIYDDPIGEKPVLFSAIPEVKQEEVLTSSRKCALIHRLDNIQRR